jgi:hypothetical protein
MDSSSGNSTGSRFAICSGLHAVTHRRSARRGLFRPFHSRATGPIAGPQDLVAIIALAISGSGSAAFDDSVRFQP